MCYDQKWCVSLPVWLETLSSMLSFPSRQTGCSVFKISHSTMRKSLLFTMADTEQKIKLGYVKSLKIKHPIIFQYNLFSPFWRIQAVSISNFSNTLLAMLLRRAVCGTNIGNNLCYLRLQLQNKPTWPQTSILTCSHIVMLFLLFYLICSLFLFLKKPYEVSRSWATLRLYQCFILKDNRTCILCFRHTFYCYASQFLCIPKDVKEKGQIVCFEHLFGARVTLPTFIE